MSIEEFARVSSIATSAHGGLRVDGLSVRYSGGRGDVLAVDDVSFDAQPGRILAVVGESGCGKSALALAIAGLLPSNAQVSGSAFLGGRDLLSIRPRELNRLRGAHIGFVFQDPMDALNPMMKVGKQVAEVYLRHTRMSRAEARERTIALFGRVGLASPERQFNAYPHQLSGGMLQRVVIAIAFALEPAVVIADEPTTALDVTVASVILDLIRGLAESQGASVMLITHDMGVVADVADDVVVLYAGRAVECADVFSLFGSPRHPYTHALLGSMPRGHKSDQGRLAEIHGTVPALRAPAASCSFSPRCPRQLPACEEVRPELEAISTGHLVSCFNPVEESGE